MIRSDVSVVGSEVTRDTEVTIITIKTTHNRFFTTTAIHLLADPRVDPSDIDNNAIQLVSCYGHDSVVKLLLADSRVDPSVDNNWAIRSASF